MTPLPHWAAMCQGTKSLRDSPLRGGVTGSTVIVDRTSSLLRQRLEPLFYRRAARVTWNLYVSIARE